MDNPDVQLTVEDLLEVYQLMLTLSCIYTQKDDYSGMVCESIGNILGTTILEVQNPDNTRPDGIIIVDVGNTCTPYMFMELKREAGEGGCDPTSQASLSMRHSWNHDLVGYNHIHLDPAFDF